METPGGSPASQPDSAADASSSANANDELITIAGGVDLEVAKQDGSKETVKVRQIPISKFQAFAFAIGWGNTADAIELYADKQKGWADTLAIPSAIELMNKGREINLPFFTAWSVDQAKWKASLAIETLAAAEKNSAKPSPSASSQPPSPISTSSPPGK
jgi:hypothetical protein